MIPADATGRTPSPPEGAERAGADVGPRLDCLLRQALLPADGEEARAETEDLETIRLKLPTLRERRRTGSPARGVQIPLRPKAVRVNKQERSGPVWLLPAAAAALVLAGWAFWVLGPGAREQRETGRQIKPHLREPGGEKPHKETDSTPPQVPKAPAPAPVPLPTLVNPVPSEERLRKEALAVEDTPVQRPVPSVTEPASGPEPKATQPEMMPAPPEATPPVLACAGTLGGPAQSWKVEHRQQGSWEAAVDAKAPLGLGLLGRPGATLALEQGAGLRVLGERSAVLRVERLRGTKTLDAHEVSTR